MSSVVTGDPSGGAGDRRRRRAGAKRWLRNLHDPAAFSNQGGGAVIALQHQTAQ
jgi:hypothetical protein